MSYNATERWVRKLIAAKFGDDSTIESLLTAIGTIPDLATSDELDALTTVVSGKAETTHTHTVADVTDITEGEDTTTVAFTSNGTPPSGDQQVSISWQRIKNWVTVNFRVEWASAGTAVTQLLVTLPAALPTPAAMNGAASGDVQWDGTGGLASDVTVSLSNNGKVALVSGSPWKVRVDSDSVALKVARGFFRYKAA